MKKNDPVVVRKAANGVILCPYYRDNMSRIDDEEVYVFNTMDQMYEWLAEHFPED